MALIALRQKQDIRSILILVACTVLFVAPYFISLSGLPAFLWISASSFLCFIASIINHNHQHLGISKHNFINGCISLYLSLLRGHSAYSIRLAHNANHHRYNCSEEDWIRPRLAGSGAGIIRLFRFVYCAGTEMAKGKKSEEANFYKGSDKKQLLLERWSVRILAIALLILNWKVSLVFVFLPWFIGVFCLIAINLLQHDGCDFDSKFNHSRNFLNPLGNWFLLNNGYHTVHHLYPQLHWSELPQKHNEKIKPYMVASLDENSLFKFFFKHYGFSKKPQ